MLNILFAKALFEPNIWGYDRKPFQGIKTIFLPVALGSIEHPGFIRETRHKVVDQMRQLVKQTKPKVVDAVIAGRQADDRLPVAPGGLPGTGA